ncbi:MAG TPA: VOC family protein [Anaerolineales bacterium]|nr:VOC family protein [Anaerolineales bacterium]
METSTPLDLSRIGQVNLPVRDLDRAIAFYRDVLKIRFLFQVPHLAFFDCGGLRLLLDASGEETHPRRSSILYFVVPDLRRSTQALRVRGVRIVSEPHLVAPMPDHDLWMSFFEDSEGNTLALMSEVRPPQGPLS